MKSVELNEIMWRTGQVGLNNVAPAPESVKPAAGQLIEVKDELILPPSMNREQRRAAARQRV